MNFRSSSAFLLFLITGSIGLSFPQRSAAQNATDRYTENFTLQNRVPGSALNKMTVESGNVRWESTPNVRLEGRGDQGYVSISDDKTFAGRLRIPEDTPLVTVKAKVAATSSTASSNWVAVGIGNPKLGCPPWGNGVFVLISSDGKFGLSGDSNPEDMESKSVVSLRAGKIPEYENGSVIVVRLEYNSVQKTVSAWINDAQIVDALSIDGKGFTVEPAYAGFSGFHQKPGAMTVEKFEVSMRP